MATASVIVRARDEAASIGRTLSLLARQTLVPEVIVVDSGSRDDTVAIARDHGARAAQPAVGVLQRRRRLPRRAVARAALPDRPAGRRGQGLGLAVAGARVA